MAINIEEISQIIRKQVEDYDKQIEVTESGTVITSSDGTARVFGLENAMEGELLAFPHGVLFRSSSQPRSARHGGGS